MSEVKCRKITNTELRERMQKVIDNIANQLREEAVDTICSENTCVPRSVEIRIQVGVDMIPTITYQKDVYVYPITAVASRVIDKK